MYRVTHCNEDAHLVGGKAAVPPASSISAQQAEAETPALGVQSCCYQVISCQLGAPCNTGRKPFNRYFSYIDLKIKDVGCFIKGNF